MEVLNNMDIRKDGKIDKITKSWKIGSVEITF